MRCRRTLLPKLPSLRAPKGRSNHVFEIKRIISPILVVTFTFLSVGPFPSSAYAGHKAYDQGHKTTQVTPPIPANPPSNPNQCTGGEPVNLKTGNFSYEQRDMFIPSRGLPIDITRSYNSQDKYNGILGYGWTFTYDIRLYRVVEENQVYIIIRHGDGIRYKFKENTDGSYTSPAGRFLMLVKTNPEDYSYKTKEGIKYNFQSGLLTSISDPNGNQMSFSYSSEGRLLMLTDTAGRELNFSYGANGKLASITDWTNRAVNYTYDSEGNLSTASDFLGNVTTYKYNTKHQITEIIDANGTAYLKNTYDSSGRVYQQFYNGADFKFQYTPASHLTTVTDRRGYPSKQYYNENGNAVKIIDELGNTTLNEWDSNMNLISTTDPNGNVTSYTYDEDGNQLTITGAQNNLTTFTYEPVYNKVTSITDALGRKTLFEYDNKGNLLKTIDAKGNQTSLSYAENGDLTKITNADNKTTAFSYNSYGYLTSTKDALGNSSYFNYDEIGNLISTTDAKGNISQFAYDLNNHLIETTDALNNKTTFEYDKNGNRTKITDAQGGITTFTYNIYDQLTIITNNLNNQTKFSYDNNENLLVTTDANNYAVATNVYDISNRLSQVTDANNAITKYTYDKAGNLISIRDPKNNTTSYTYDSLNRRIKTVYPDFTSEIFVYDSVGNITAKTDRSGRTINYSYDELNRIMTKTYPDNSTVDYVYDSLSRLFSIKNASSNISYTYDALNRLTKAQTVSGDFNSAVSYEYDVVGNKTKLIYPDSSYITYAYDELNRLIAVKDQSSNNIATYGYDSLSRRTQLDLANNTQATYQYDSINRLLNLVNKIKNSADISNYTYTYDKVDNRLSMVNAQGTNTYVYDRMSQLTQSSLNSVSTYRGYDGAGNVYSKGSTGTSTITYTVNTLNQYTKVGTNTSYAYDSNGNMTNDGTFTYGYDYENRLTSSVRGAVGDEAIHTYDALGRRIRKEVTAGGELSTVNYVYDGDQIIAEYDSTGTLTKKYVYGPGIDEPIGVIATPALAGEAIYYYHFDGLGSVTEITDSAGAVIEKYQYDDFGVPTIKDTGGNVLQTSGIGNSYLYTGREYDSETGLYYYRARHYSPVLGRFLQVDPVGYLYSMNLYLYCSNNPINFVDALGLCKEKSLWDKSLRELWDEWVYNWQHPNFDMSDEEINNIVISFSTGIKFVGKGRITTILGSRADILKYLGKKGFNVLNIKNWTPLKNIKWLDEAIQRMDKFKIVTNPLKHQELMKKLDKPSVFTDLELPHLFEKGFKNKGSEMVR